MPDVSRIDTDDVYRSVKLDVSSEEQQVLEYAVELLENDNPEWLDYYTTSETGSVVRFAGNVRELGFKLKQVNQLQTSTNSALVSFLWKRIARRVSLQENYRRGEPQ